MGYGAVYLLPGSPTGLTGQGSQVWRPSSRGVSGQADPESTFGSALAIGRLDDDRYMDLAVGASGDYIGDKGGGSVTLLRGSRGGLTTAGWGGRRLHEGVPGIAGSIGGAFGDPLTIARVQGKKQANLIIGNPLGNVGRVPAGRIHQSRATNAGRTLRERGVSMPTPPALKAYLDDTNTSAGRSAETLALHRSRYGAQTRAARRRCQPQRGEVATELLTAARRRHR